ncbi:MAG: ATP-binding cassette domain-containing protein [Polyangiaceae bacterium]
MPTTVPSTLELDDVAHRFDEVIALSSISLCVRPGEIVGVVGPSGSGKSTLLRIASGVLKPKAGVARVGQTLAHKAARGVIAYLPPDDALSSRHRVSDEATFFQNLRGLASPDVEAWARSWRQRFIAETSRKRVSELPDGYRRCIELGATLKHPAALVTLDTPFRSLTGSLASAAVIAIAEAASNGSAVVLTDPRLDLLDTLCTRIIVMKQGRIAHDGVVGAIANVGIARVWVIRTDADLSGCEQVEKAIPVGRDTRVTLREGASREAFLRWVLDQGARIEALRPARSLADVLSESE